MGTRRRNPADACRFLADEFGVTTSKSTLAKMRCLGGGPKFVKFGRSVLYEEPALIEWATGKLSRPMSSTSDARAVA